MNKLMPILILLISAISVHAGDDADQLVTRLMEKKQIPGLALLVIQNGEIVKAKGYGFANIELQVPVKPETIFQSGSMGKQFTATAIMMLVEEGKIHLDDPISKYFKNTPKSWKGITVRNLLTHTSGLGDYPDNFDFRKDYTEAELLEIVKKTPLSFKPGEKWSYSNLGYLTLGVLIREVSGKFYGDFLQERIFQPLGMNSTRVISEEDIIPNRAAGYRLENKKLKNQEWVSPTLNTTADGALYFTILDLANWDAALNSEKLLTKSSLDLMWTPVKLKNNSTYPYGFGWGFEEKEGHRIIEHGGAWQGFTTYIARYIDDHLTVVVLTNLSGAGPGYIAHAVAGLYEPAVAPLKHTAIEVNKDILDSYSGEYRVESGRIIKIDAGQNKLLGIYGEETFELIPETENSFFVEDAELTVTFAKNEHGKVTHLVLHYTDENQTAKKIR